MIVKLHLTFHITFIVSEAHGLQYTTIDIFGLFLAVKLIMIVPLQCTIRCNCSVILLLCFVQIYQREEEVKVKVVQETEEDKMEGYLAVAKRLDNAKLVCI